MLLARAAAFCGLLINLTMGRPLGAQERSLLELGVSYVRFPQDTVSVAGPTIRWATSREGRQVAAGGSVTGIVTSGGASAYGEATARWRAAVAPSASVELGGDAGLLVSSDSRISSANSSSVVVSARMLRSIDAGGLWARGSGNVASREAGALWGRGMDVGGWWKWPGVQLVASVTREWTVGELFTGPRRAGLVGVVPVHYTEGEAGLRVERDAASLELSGSARRDPGADHLVEPGFTGTATYWPTPTRSLFINVARQLPDFVRGAEATQSVTLGIRFSEPSPAAQRLARVRPIVQIGDADTASAAPARRMLRVRAPGATRVEVMGDFTEWAPVELTPSDGAFSAAFALGTGSHRMAVRLDGGAWAPAANTPAIDDDFGGKVGLLVVP